MSDATFSSTTRVASPFLVSVVLPLASVVDLMIDCCCLTPLFAMVATTLLSCRALTA